jgi:formylglycine-generating enzyme required for sulfatase activity
MGWGTQPAVFPPHLQLACSVLTEELAPGDATLTLAHYKRLGGFDAIVGEHLERVLDTELTDGRDQIARALFVALVTAGHERAMRPESELIAMVGDADRVNLVLEVLRSRGLVVRVRGDDGEPSWELAHDSLVPRVRAWIDARDLARRRATELVRYHLRRSRADEPSLLTRAELREIKSQPDAIVELDAEWRRRATGEPWTPSRLIARSRQVLHRRIAMIASLVALASVVAGVAIHRSSIDSERRRRDLGRFVLQLEPFDWAPAAQQLIRVDPAKLSLAWEIHSWDSDDAYGDRVPDDDIVYGTPQLESGALVEHIEARGGRAFLLLKRGDCKPSIIPLHDLPGYAKRELVEPVLHVPVPVCAATLADTIVIPEGEFIFGGPGEPASQAVAADPDPDLRNGVRVKLPAYRIDRTEVSNAAFAVFASMAPFTNIASPSYPTSPGLEQAGEPKRPVTGLNWHVARAYCRFLGKELPSSRQWVKAMRGGVVLPDGAPNPLPNRNLPWGIGDPYVLARLDSAKGAADVGTYPGDRSPYGVLDLTGNAMEWTDTLGGPGVRIVRGGSSSKEVADAIIDYMAVENARAESQVLFNLGMRCALNI